VANSAQAIKRTRQIKRRTLLNASQRSEVRTAMKKILSAIKKDSKQAATDAFKITKSMIDKAVSRGVYHKNKAARLKSRLNKKIKALG